MIAHQGKTIEARREAAQREIDSTRSPAERNRLGQFATPYDLALQITRYVDQLLGVRTGGIRFADPSIGTGSFFSAALAVFGPRRMKSAVGVEIDPLFAKAAHNLWAGDGLKVLCADFTRLVANGTCPAAPDLILANPPYVRHHHISRQDKERLQRLTFQLTQIQVNGLAGLYVYFLLIATAWMQDEGHAAWLVPSEFMDVNYGAALKTFLTERVTLLRVHRFAPQDVQFGDAFVSSVILVFKKAPPPVNHEIEFTFGGTLEHPLAQDRLPLDHLRLSRKWTIHPRHSKNDRHILGPMAGPVLGDFFRIQRGIATGDNGFFVLDRAAAKRLGLPERYLHPILPSPRHLKAIVINAAEDGYPVLDRQLCVIDCDLPEHTVKECHPSLWEYLQTADALDVKKGYLVGKRHPWYKQEQRKPCPFLCTYMGRGSDDKRPFRFIMNRSKAIATNLYLMLYPVRGLETMLRDHPERLDEIHTVLCQITGHELRGEGRVYGGGLHKIEPRELARISAVELVTRWPELRHSLRNTLQESLFD